MKQGKPYLYRLYHRIVNWFLLRKANRNRIPCPAIHLPALQELGLASLNQLAPVNHIGKERGTMPRRLMVWTKWYNTLIKELCHWWKGFAKLAKNPSFKQSVIVMQEGMNGKMGNNCTFEITDMDQRIQFTGTYDWARKPRPLSKPCDPDKEGFPPSVIKRRLQHYLKNKPLIDSGIPANAIKANGPCYIIGNGPSLNKQAHLLKNVTKGTRIALNGGYKKCFPYVDYFWCGDWLGMKHWLEGIDVSGHRAIFTIHAPAFLTEREWKNRFWYSHHTSERHTRAMLWDLKKSYGIENMPLYDQGVTVTYTAYHWAVVQGFDPIIFVGVDGLLTEEGFLHTDDKNDTEKDKEQIVAHQMEHLAFCSFLEAATVFANRMGIRVINAAPMGESILGHNPIYRDKHRMEHIPLEKVIDEMESR